MADYAGHAPYSAGKLALDSVDGDVTLVAPADAGKLFSMDDGDGGTWDSLADFYDANPDAAGAGAFANGYPRADGGPASAGHFGG